MYRRHVARRREGRRLNSRGEEEDSDQEMVQSSEVPHVEFISRVSKLPLVSSAIEYASDVYGKAKGSSPALIQKTLDTAEGTMKYAVNRATPVINTLEKPIHAVDVLACMTLDKVEETLPVVTKQPSEIMEGTLNIVSGTVQTGIGLAGTGIGLVGTVTDTVMGNRLGESIINTALGTLKIAEDSINHYLPPGPEGEPSVDLDEPGEPSKKIVLGIRHTFGLAGAVWSRSQQALHHVGVQGLVFLGALIQVMDWMQSHWSEVRIKGLPDKIREQAAEFRQNMSTAGPGQESMSLIRGLTNVVAGLIRTTMNMTIGLPLKRMEDALNIVTDFSAKIAKQTHLDDFTLNAMAMFRQAMPLVYHPMVELVTLSTDLTKKVFPNWNFDIDKIVTEVDRRMHHRQVHFEEQHED